MSADALVANGPQLAIGDAFEFLVLGMDEEARSVLEFAPRLQIALANENQFRHFPEHRRREAAAYLREYLLLATWLSTGSMGPELAAEAYAHTLALNQWWGSSVTGANLLHLMLLALEAQNPSQALEDYQRYEKKAPASPTVKQASRNGRALLYAFHAKPQPFGIEERAKARAAFLSAATKWEKDRQPLPYIGIITLARIVRACSLAEGVNLSLKDLLAQVA